MDSNPLEVQRSDFTRTSGLKRTNSEMASTVSKVRVVQKESAEYKIDTTIVRDEAFGRMVKELREAKLSLEQLKGEHERELIHKSDTISRLNEECTRLFSSLEKSKLDASRLKQQLSACQDELIEQERLVKENNEKTAKLQRDITALSTKSSDQISQLGACMTEKYHALRQVARLSHELAQTKDRAIEAEGALKSLECKMLVLRDDAVGKDLEIIRFQDMNCDKDATIFKLLAEDLKLRSTGHGNAAQWIEEGCQCAKGTAK